MNPEDDEPLSETSHHGRHPLRLRQSLAVYAASLAAWLVIALVILAVIRC